MRKTLLAALMGLLTACGGSGSPSSPPDPPNPVGGMSGSDMQSFLVETVCVDGAGNPVNELPFACSVGSRQHTETDRVYWRKFDWPAPGGPLAGYQISDSMLAVRNNSQIVTQTFDFVEPNGVIDPTSGGDGMVVENGVAGIFVTQDGSVPQLRWWISQTCQSSGIAAGWVSFMADVTSGQWTSIVAHLNGVLAGSARPACQLAHVDAYTRYRRETIDVTFRGNLTDLYVIAPSMTTIPLDVIVSEHYNSGSIETATQMERFYYARGWGKIRWESWSKNDFGTDPSPRCPAVDYSSSPASGWTLNDCRYWTNILTTLIPSTTWPPADLRW